MGMAILGYGASLIVGIVWGAVIANLFGTMSDAQKLPKQKGMAIFMAALISGLVLFITPVIWVALLACGGTSFLVASEERKSKLREPAS